MNQIHHARKFFPVIVLALAALTTRCGGGGGSIAGGEAARAVQVSISPDTASIRLSTSSQFSATVLNATNTAVTWSIIGAGALDEAGKYSAPASLPSDARVTITATSQQDTTKSASATVTITSNESVSLSPQSPTVIPGGQQQFTATVSGSSTNTAVTWSAASGTINSFSGLYTAPVTVPTSGTDTVTATSLADSTKKGTATVLLTRTSSQFTVTTATLPNGTEGVGYSASLAASGGTPPYAWSLAAGSLPSGLALSTSGIISGTPAVGSYTFTIRVNDAGGQIVSKTFTVSVASLLSILTTSLPNGVVAVAYSATLAASGGTPPYTWSLASGQLPAGLSLSTSGIESGTPTAAGSCGFTIQVNDSGGQTASRSYSASIASPLGITTTSLSNGMVNVAYSDSLSATGGTPPYTWSLSAGSLPAGVTLSSSGTISGTATIPGSYSFTIQVSDSGGQNAPQAFGVTIYADTSLDQYGGVTQQPCPNGPTGDWYTQQIGKRWVLCDPLGNAFILRAVSEVGQTDSHTDATYVPSSEAATVTAKYPSGTDVFSNASFARLQTWGFNASGYGTYHNATVSTITPIKMPFVDGLSQANNPWMGCEASAQCKNIWNLLWPPLHAYDSDTSHNDPDVYEPTYPSYLATAYASDSNIKNWSASPYAVGFYNGDSDYCSFCSAGNDFPNSVYWPHAIWMTLGSAPHVWLNRRGSNALYTSSTNNTKAQLASYLQTEYETISALNTAWNTGGYYTTFGSSGTQVSGGACATGTGGSGPYTCSPNTNIDPFSLEILVGGTPVCADDGFGNLDAPGGATAGCGTVTYSTGAISVSYTVATGTAITLNYWYNGYGVGTGLLDEWCNQSVHAWVGDIQCLNNGFAGNGTCNPGSVTTAAYQTDLNNFLQQYATEFFSLLHTAYVNSLPSGHTHKLWFGMDVIGQVPGRAPARCPVLAAAGVVNDVVMLSTDTSTAQLNFITSCVGNKPFIIWENVSANCDSDWYGYCSTETNAGNVANQNVRAVQFNTDITDLWNYQSSAGNYQWVGFDWWAFLSFNFWEHQNFGLVSWRDNAYDGHEDVSGSVSCSAPISSYTCGGEQHNYGNFLGPATLTNNWADTQLLLLK